MKRLAAIGLTAAVLFAPVAASAQLRIRSQCYHGTCTTYISRVVPGAGLGQAVDVPQPTEPADMEAAAARIAQWEKYCQPKIVVDKLGVSRYGYAHSGCDVGNVGDGKR